MLLLFLIKLLIQFPFFLIIIINFIFKASIAASSN